MGLDLGSVRPGPVVLPANSREVRAPSIRRAPGLAGSRGQAALEAQVAVPDLGDALDSELRALDSEHARDLVVQLRHRRPVGRNAHHRVAVAAASSNIRRPKKAR